jgi:hypothetical protein
MFFETLNRLYTREENLLIFLEDLTNIHFSFCKMKKRRGFKKNFLENDNSFRKFIKSKICQAQASYSPNKFHKKTLKKIILTFVFYVFQASFLRFVSIIFSNSLKTGIRNFISLHFLTFKRKFIPPLKVCVLSNKKISRRGHLGRSTNNK